MQAATAVRNRSKRSFGVFFAYYWLRPAIAFAKVISSTII
jgi:hypothetical protein